MIRRALLVVVVFVWVSARCSGLEAEAPAEPRDGTCAGLPIHWSAGAASAARLGGSLALQAGPEDKEAKKSTQSRIEKRTYDFKDAGKEMEYALFVPSSYDRAKKTPLVV